MKKLKIILPLITTVFWLSPAQSASESQLSAIEGMGQVNGVALQCRYMDQMQRIKMTLVLHLPKQRALGDWFEQTTNSSFMDFMSKGGSCPDSVSFAEQVDAAIKNIEIAFEK